MGRIIEPDRLNKINPDLPFTLRERSAPPGPRPRNAGGFDQAWFAVNGIRRDDVAEMTGTQVPMRFERE